MAFLPRRGHAAGRPDSFGRSGHLAAAAPMPISLTKTNPIPGLINPKCLFNLGGYHFRSHGYHYDWGYHHNFHQPGLTLNPVLTLIIEHLPRIHQKSWFSTERNSISRTTV